MNCTCIGVLSLLCSRREGEGLVCMTRPWWSAKHDVPAQHCMPGAQQCACKPSQQGMRGKQGPVPVSDEKLLICSWK